MVKDGESVQQETQLQKVKDGTFRSRVSVGSVVSALEVHVMLESGG